MANLEEYFDVDEDNHLKLKSNISLDDETSSKILSSILQEQMKMVESFTGSDKKQANESINNLFKKTV